MLCHAVFLYQLIAKYSFYLTASWIIEITSNIDREYLRETSKAAYVHDFVTAYLKQLENKTVIFCALLF